MSLAPATRLAAWRPSRETVAWGALVLCTELLLVLLYLVANAERVTVTKPFEVLVLPWIWINVGALAVIKTRPAPSSRRNRTLAAAVGVGYFLVLAAVGGLVSPLAEVALALDYSVAAIPPGWGPIVTLQVPFLDLTLLPYKVVGYLALAYLVYATALDASNALVGGIVGLFSCVSCTFPVIASVLTGLAGSGTALAGLAYSNAYLVSTGVFVLTVGLLYWRPVAGASWGAPFRN